jgi:hypothetical protein
MERDAAYYNSDVVLNRPDSTRRLRLLYLGFAFPPGVAALHPGLNPAGHALETQMIAELRESFDVRSTGVLPMAPPKIKEPDPDSGVDHDLILLEKSPELFHRFRSLACLKAQYRRWRASGWEPDAVLVYNLSPIYNQFLLWLRRHSPRPKLVLLLLDSPSLGVPVQRWKRFRRCFKPMYTADCDMIWRFDACIGLSKATERYFLPRKVPFLWMPGGCRPARARFSDDCSFPERNGSLRLGYFGNLADHAGVQSLIETVLSAHIPVTLEICGYGKLADSVSAMATHNQRLRFHGLLTPAQCLGFGRACDVLVNPRPSSHGNENNFSSKLFDYALAGRSILTSTLSGVEEVLGPDAFYFDPQEFEKNLQRSLHLLAGIDRSELDRRGRSVQERVLSDFSWTRQGARLTTFLSQVCTGRRLKEETSEALAA